MLRAIDPEFAFYGPIGFDLGAPFGNLLLSWYSQFGYWTADDDRSVQRAMDSRPGERCSGRRSRIRFLALWAEHLGRRCVSECHVSRTHGCRRASSPRARRPRMTLFQDMLGPRCLQDDPAHPDSGARSRSRRHREPRRARGLREGAALAMATTLLRHPEHFKSTPTEDSGPRRCRACNCVLDNDERAFAYARSVSCAAPTPGYTYPPMSNSPALRPPRPGSSAHSWASPAWGGGSLMTPASWCARLRGSLAAVAVGTRPHAAGQHETRSNRLFRL